MRQLAEGVHQLRGFPPNAINVYLVDDVLVDGASRHAERRILRELGDRGLAAHVVTQAHPDHQGSSHAICERLSVPLWCGAADAEATESGRLAERQPRHPLNRLSEWAFAGPGHPVARRLHEGDGVADLDVLETPGHSAGHIALWRERDRTLIVGDVLFGCHPLTGIPGLHKPPVSFTPGAQPRVGPAVGRARAGASALRAWTTVARPRRAHRLRGAPRRLRSSPCRGACRACALLAERVERKEELSGASGGR